jgi:DNA-binding transcriptional LysR family regulator
MGNLPDDAAGARAITFSSLALYAAPNMPLARPARASGRLFKHDLLSLPPRQGSMVHWTLVRGKTRWERDLPVRLLANSPELLVRMAAGIGIAASTELIARPLLQDGGTGAGHPRVGLPAGDGLGGVPRAAADAGQDGCSSICWKACSTRRPGVVCGCWRQLAIVSPSRTAAGCQPVELPAHLSGTA